MIIRRYYATLNIFNSIKIKFILCDNDKVSNNELMKIKSFLNKQNL